MDKILNSPVDKSIFFISNLIIIALQENTTANIIVFSFYFLILLFQKVNMKKKLLIYIPALLFLIPPLLVEGISIKEGTLALNIDYFIFMRVMATVTVSAIYILSMTFKEFCSLMNFLKLPNIIVEIVIYMYKFIIIMIRNFNEHKTSYRNRNGKYDLKGVANLSVMVFKRLYRDIKNMEIAMYIRGYRDTYPFQKSLLSLSYKKVLISIVYVVVATKILEGY